MEQRHLVAQLRQKAKPEVTQLALEAVMRRDELQPAARLALFREFADYFRSLIPYPIEVSEHVSDEQFVRNAIDVLFQRSVLEDNAFQK